jgi:hypothetical protein
VNGDLNITRLIGVVTKVLDQGKVEMRLSNVVAPNPCEFVKQGFDVPVVVEQKSSFGFVNHVSDTIE